MSDLLTARRGSRHQRQGDPNATRSLVQVVAQKLQLKNTSITLRRVLLAELRAQRVIAEAQAAAYQDHASKLAALLAELEAA